MQSLTTQHKLPSQQYIQQQQAVQGSLPPFGRRNHSNDSPQRNTNLQKSGAQVFKLQTSSTKKKGKQFTQAYESLFPATKESYKYVNLEGVSKELKTPILQKNQSSGVRKSEKMTLSNDCSQESVNE